MKYRRILMVWICIYKCLIYFCSLLKPPCIKIDVTKLSIDVRLISLNTSDLKIVCYPVNPPHVIKQEDEIPYGIPNQIPFNNQDIPYLLFSRRRQFYIPSFKEGHEFISSILVVFALKKRPSQFVERLVIEVVIIISYYLAVKWDRLLYLANPVVEFSQSEVCLLCIFSVRILFNQLIKNCNRTFPVPLIHVPAG